MRIKKITSEVEIIKVTSDWRANFQIESRRKDTLGTVNDFDFICFFGSNFGTLRIC